MIFNIVTLLIDIFYILAVPDQVNTFTRTSSTLNTVTLSWTHGSGERESYTISWGDNEKEENIPSTDTNRTFTGLKPGQSYTFSIVAVSKNKESAAVTVDVTLTGKYISYREMSLYLLSNTLIEN